VWLNFIPIIWGNRGTIEFRCHVPTVSAQKVINWLYICIAILEFAKKNIPLLVSQPFNEIGEINLEMVLEKVYPSNICNILNKYISDRKKHYACKNDAIGETEIYGEERDKEIFKLIPFV